MRLTSAVITQSQFDLGQHTSKDTSDGIKTFTIRLLGNSTKLKKSFTHSIGQRNLIIGKKNLN